MTMEPRSLEQRTMDTLDRLEGDVDAWMSTADRGGRPYLVPLSFRWDGATLLFATPAASPTARNAARTGLVRLGLGATRDVVMIEGTVEVLAAADANVADAFAARAGFEPREESNAYAYLRVTPRRVQAWREANELAGRELMRDGRWLLEVEVDVHGPDVLSWRDDLVAVYAAAFGAPGYDEPYEAAQRFGADQLPQHAARDGFRCAVARRAGRAVGFAYGYTGERGQWWSDRLVDLAPPDIVERWVGGHFEFVELAVRPTEQGHGVGTALHDALLAGLPHDRALLSTYRDDRPAPRLYRRRGWRVLVEGIDETSDLYGVEL